MDALTDTQHAILALIAERIEAEGMPPSQAEIARAFGFSGVYLFLVATLCLYSIAHTMRLATEAADDSRSIV